jgi:hypothetical protein
LEGDLKTPQATMSFLFKKASKHFDVLRSTSKTPQNTSTHLKAS